MTEKQMTDNENTILNLPPLKPKQVSFVMQHILLKEAHPLKAYRIAYNAENMSAQSASVEAQKLLKNPKIALWLDYYRNHARRVLEDEFSYGINDAFKELNEIQKLSMHSSKTYNVARACVEDKCRLKGLYNEKPIEVNASVKMPELTISGGNLTFKIGGNENPLSPASRVLSGEQTGGNNG